MEIEMQLKHFPRGFHAIFPPQTGLVCITDMPSYLKFCINREIPSDGYNLRVG